MWVFSLLCIKVSLVLKVDYKTINGMFVCFEDLIDFLKGFMNGAASHLATRRVVPGIF